MCETCAANFAQHNPDQSGPICACTGCQVRKSEIRKTEQRERKTVATVNFCERCNTMGKSSAMGAVSTQECVYNSPVEGKEICPGCVGDLKQFMRGEAVPALADVERPKSYSEPYSERQSDPLAGLSDDELARAYLARVARQEGLNELPSGPQDNE